MGRRSFSLLLVLALCSCDQSSSGSNTEFAENPQILCNPAFTSHQMTFHGFRLGDPHAKVTKGLENPNTDYVATTDASWWFEKGHLVGLRKRGTQLTALGISSR